MKSKHNVLEEDDDMVKHVLADGRQIDSVDGYAIPSTGRSEAVYRIVKRVHAESEQQKRLYAHNTNKLNELRIGVVTNKRIL